MKKIHWAYIVEVIHIITALIIVPFLVKSEGMQYFVNLLVLAAAFGLVANLLLRDARERKLSTMLAAWALLGILGVFIYHITTTDKKLTKGPIKGETAALILGVLSAVFAFLFFPLGLLLSIITIILATLLKRKEHTQKTNISLLLGAGAIVFAGTLILVMGGLVTSLNKTESEMANMTVNEAIAHCNEKSLFSYMGCLYPLFDNYADDERVSSGAVCNQEDELRIYSCVKTGLDRINTIEFCEGIESTEYKTFCTAVINLDKELCDQLNSDNKDNCVKEITAREFANKLESQLS